MGSLFPISKFIFGPNDSIFDDGFVPSTAHSKLIFQGGKGGHSNSGCNSGSGSGGGSKNEGRFIVDPNGSDSKKLEPSDSSIHQESLPGKSNDSPTSSLPMVTLLPLVKCISPQKILTKEKSSPQSLLDN